MIEQLAMRVMQARNVAHKEHLKTSSYAQHMALGSFYEDVIGVLDDVVEVYQGMYGLIEIPLVEDKEVESITDYLNDEANWIESNRAKFAKCNAVLNLIDGLTAIYLRTNYKLVNLL